METLTQQLISDDRRLDMLTGALEGGSNYWYCISGSACNSIRKHSTAIDGSSLAEKMFSAMKNRLIVPIRDAEEPSEILGKISYRSIIAGEAKMLKEQPQHFADIIAENDDATTADVWFQYAVLGEVVYG